jgi:uncharacterized cupredoxin-like copper-binding protein
MHRNKHTIGLVAASVAVSLALAGAAAAALMGHRSAQATRVIVTESEYKIVLAPAKLHAGTTTFVVRNRGKLAHALDITGPGPTAVRVPMIAPGKSRTVTVKLAGGTFRLWCPVPGHAALGMSRSLVVSGAAGGASSGGTTPGTTTGSGDAWG